MPTTSESFRAAVEELLDDRSKLGYHRHDNSGPHGMFPDPYDHDEGEPAWSRSTSDLTPRARRVGALSPELADED